MAPSVAILTSTLHLQNVPLRSRYVTFFKSVALAWNVLLYSSLPRVIITVVNDAGWIGNGCLADGNEYRLLKDLLINYDSSVRKWTSILHHSFDCSLCTLKWLRIEPALGIRRKMKMKKNFVECFHLQWRACASFKSSLGHLISCCQKLKDLN